MNLVSLQACARMLVFFMLFKISKAKVLDQSSASAEVEKTVASAKFLKKGIYDELAKYEDLEASFPEFFSGPSKIEKNNKISQMNETLREKGIECDFDNKVKAIGMDVLNEAAIDVTGMIKKDFVDPIDNIEKDLKDALNTELERCEKTQSPCVESEQFANAKGKADNMIKELNRFKKHLSEFFFFVWSLSSAKAIRQIPEEEVLKKVEQIFDECLHQHV